MEEYSKQLNKMLGEKIGKAIDDKLAGLLNIPNTIVLKTLCDTQIIFLKTILECVDHFIDNEITEMENPLDYIVEPNWPITYFRDYLNGVLSVGVYDSSVYGVSILNTIRKTKKLHILHDGSTYKTYNL